jgi:hypothetical protein
MSSLCPGSQTESRTKADKERAMTNTPLGIETWRGESSRSGACWPQGEIRITVVFTTRKGTQAALRKAGSLAKGLGARIRLVAAYEVPIPFPLDKPPVLLEVLEQRHVNMVKESGVEAEEVRIDLFLCPDQKACLKDALKERSLVVVGGRPRRWWNRARRIERWLNRMGKQVVFVTE